MRGQAAARMMNLRIYRQPSDGNRDAPFRYEQLKEQIRVQKAEITDSDGWNRTSTRQIEPGEVAGAREDREIQDREAVQGDTVIDTSDPWIQEKSFWLEEDGGIHRVDQTCPDELACLWRVAENQAIPKTTEQETAVPRQAYIPCLG